SSCSALLSYFNCMESEWIWVTLSKITFTAAVLPAGCAVNGGSKRMLVAEPMGAVAVAAAAIPVIPALDILMAVTLLGGAVLDAGTAPGVEPGLGVVCGTPPDAGF